MPVVIGVATGFRARYHHVKQLLKINRFVESVLLIPFLKGIIS